MLHGDTQIAAKGMDTYGSRSLVVGAEAVMRAADKVIEKAKPIAAHLLEASGTTSSSAVADSQSRAPTRG